MLKIEWMTQYRIPSGMVTVIKTVKIIIEGTKDNVERFMQEYKQGKAEMGHVLVEEKKVFL